jgi:hypothetical protein
MVERPATRAAAVAKVLMRSIQISLLVVPEFNPRLIIAFLPPPFGIMKVL